MEKAQSLEVPRAARVSCLLTGDGVSECCGGPAASTREYSRTLLSKISILVINKAKGKEKAKGENKRE